MARMTMRDWMAMLAVFGAVPAGAQPAPAIRTVDLPPSAPARAEQGPAAVAERYDALARSEPAMQRIWSACAAAAREQGADAGAAPAAAIDALRPMLTDPKLSPCPDAIPQAAWDAVPVRPPTPEEAAQADEAARLADQARLRALNQREDARAASEAARLAEQRRAYDAQVAASAAAQTQYDRERAAYEASKARADAAEAAYRRQIEAYRRAGGRDLPR